VWGGIFVGDGDGDGDWDGAAYPELTEPGVPMQRDQVGSRSMRQPRSNGMRGTESTGPTIMVSPQSRCSRNEHTPLHPACEIAKDCAIELAVRGVGIRPEGPELLGWVVVSQVVEIAGRESIGAVHRLSAANGAL
jgi:hypothetical protein